MDEKDTILDLTKRLIECLDSESQEEIGAVSCIEALSGEDAILAMSRIGELIRMKEQLIAFHRHRERDSISRREDGTVRVTRLPEAGAMMTNSKLALNRQEAARSLGISVVSLDRLVRRRLITPSNALRRPLFSITELERFIRESC